MFASLWLAMASDSAARRAVIFWVRWTYRAAHAKRSGPAATLGRRMSGQGPANRNDRARRDGVITRPWWPRNGISTEAAATRKLTPDVALVITGFALRHGAAESTQGRKKWRE